MKVSELIDRLGRLNPEADVLVPMHSMEQPFTPFVSAREVRLGKEAEGCPVKSVFIRGKSVARGETFDMLGAIFE